MDLQAIFPENSVCLYSQLDNIKTWRISNVHYTSLNYLRKWLLSRSLSVAITWIQIDQNLTVFKDEHLGQRLGLIPISADPLNLEDFPEREPNLCAENTCLVFDLNVSNDTNQTRDVLSGDLRWIPLGNQVEIFRNNPPRPTDDNLLIAKLQPRQRLSFRAYAIRGTGSQHVKWTQLFPFFTDQSINYPGETRMQSCISCDQLKIGLQAGLDCYYFTIELLGGLTFENIDRQLREVFRWDLPI